jgi:hypothetical protein
MATIDGSAVFGLAVHVQHNPHPNAQQMNEFFGVNGNQTLFGGTRGRTLLISGVFIGNSIGDINAAESALLSFADGLPHTLSDDRGRSFPNIIFRGDYQSFEQGPRLLAGGGYCMPFKCTMMGLT